MALIENLDKGDWREFLGSMFGYTLDVLQNDRHRSVGSAVDDLRAWLAQQLQFQHDALHAAL